MRGPGLSLDERSWVDVSDNGSEFTCDAMLAWCRDSAIGRYFKTTGKQIQNAFAQSFNGRMGDES